MTQYGNGSAGTPSVFRVGDLYSSEHIQHALQVGNAGGVRVSVTPAGEVKRAVVLTSTPSGRQARENPYHDRLEGEVLVYTGAGREGDQTLAGINKRLPQQLLSPFPIYAFLLVGSRRDPSLGPNRWRFLGLLQFLRHYPDTQIDTRGALRRVWIFEFQTHVDPPVVPVALDDDISRQLLANPVLGCGESVEDREIVSQRALNGDRMDVDPSSIETARASLLAVEPRRFEHLIQELLVATGFDRVATTRYSQDGGIDVNAHVGSAIWPIASLLVQVQAKRWLHTVGRREVAELRGSLQPHASGAIVTTSHYSRAAICEARDPSKRPITLVDGYTLASLFLANHVAIQ